jgi:hypothetical protein
MRSRPCPAQASQRPPGTLKEKRLASQPRSRASGTRAKRRRLIDLDRAGEVLDALDRAMRADAPGGQPEGAAHAAVEDVAHERRLARARHAGDARPGAEGERHVDPAEVVLARAAHDERWPPVEGARGAEPPARAREVAAGRGGGIGRQRRRRAHRHHAAPVDAGAGAQVDDQIGAADGRLVVLDYHHRVAARAQRLEGVEQQRVVAGMEPDGRLVEDVAHPAEIRAELGGEPDALRLPAGERIRAAVEGEVAEPHLREKAQPRQDLAQRPFGDRGIARAKAQPPERRLGLVHRERRKRRDGLAREPHGERAGV